MVQDRRGALAQYGRVIQEKGAMAGERVIEKYEKVFPDFRNLARAVGLILRAAELLEEEEEALSKR